MTICQHPSQRRGPKLRLCAACWGHSHCRAVLSQVIPLSTQTRWPCPSSAVCLSSVCCLPMIGERVPEMNVPLPQLDHLVHLAARSGGSMQRASKTLNGRKPSHRGAACPMNGCVDPRISKVTCPWYTPHPLLALVSPLPPYSPFSQFSPVFARFATNKATQVFRRGRHRTLRQNRELWWPSIFDLFDAALLVWYLCQCHYFDLWSIFTCAAF